MKTKKYLIIAIIVILAILGTVYFFFREDSETSLNVLEKQWIESNKNNVIDLSVVSDVPIISYNGKGIIIDFLDSLKNETSLTFNKVSYKKGNEINTPYAVKITDSVSENDVVIYEDNYVITTKEGEVYNSTSQLSNLTIGVLNDNLDGVNKYINSSDVTYKTFATLDEMLTEFTTTENLNAIVLLKTTNLDTILTNNFQISYDILDYKMYYTFQFGSEDRLNSILTKYYNNWSLENYETSYGESLTTSYLTLTNVSDNDQINFKSKRYEYGYIENAPYDTLIDSSLEGINPALLAQFSEYTDTEISYQKYNDINALVNAFNSNEIDFYYAINEDTEFNIDIYQTEAVYDNKIVVLGNIENLSTYSTLKSLSSVGSLFDSYISSYLLGYEITVNNYSNYSDLLKSKEAYIAIDLQVYNYLKDELKDFVIVDVIDSKDYSFNIREINESSLFAQFLDFYISFTNTENIINIGLNNTLVVNELLYLLRNSAIILGVTFGILLVLLFVVKIKPKKQSVSFSKEDKIRYTDALTSLKNRNYLNDSIDKWDNSEVYPQAIIIIDLKNIAYINDNYGHTEGDNVIIQAANTLITNQLENTEILRTNGNEFLVYMVGYNEKIVITHIRKLHKEMKELKHNFGCAIGYSMINDGIKTIDDAINEASLDMRNNKEENNE